VLTVDGDLTGTDEPSSATHEVSALLLESVDRDLIVPVVGCILPDPAGYRLPIR
jgi:hypothetical protein